MRFHSELKTIGVSLAILTGAVNHRAATEHVNHQDRPPQNHCQVTRQGERIALHSPAFIFRLDTAQGLRAVSWENKLTGRSVSLGNGLEAEVDLDVSEMRIPITGWRATSNPSPDDTAKAGPEDSPRFARPEFDDRAWRGIQSGALGEGASLWRTHVFLPEKLAATDLSLTLGGFGLFDFRHLDVYVNGRKLGERNAVKRWNEPAVFHLRSGTEAHKGLRFGQDNLIAVQAKDFVTRNEHLNQFDPEGHKALSAMHFLWPAQFEQYLVAGRPLQTPKLAVTAVQDRTKADAGEVMIKLQAIEPKIAFEVTYQWRIAEPVLTKSVRISNGGDRPLALLNVRLGSYATDADVSEGEQGFPVYLDQHGFMSLAHPSGWAIGQDRKVSLRQYPGTKLTPGETFQCMDTVLGVAAPGQARAAFRAGVQNRCRRVQRGHDKPYAVFESFGGQAGDNNFNATEEYLLDNIAKLAEGQRDAGYAFDFYSIQFWVDPLGDLQDFARSGFPNGFVKVKEQLRKIGLPAGLWLGDTALNENNPVVRNTWTHDPAYGAHHPTLCRAIDPIKTMFPTALLHHVRENGARLFKFDGPPAICYNPTHAHLPGVYSTEAIQSAVIETLDKLDAACPDVFLMLYWGHRSPWWLLHADTVFEPGLAMEAATIGSSPALYVRDSVTVGLDQAQSFCEDVPALGKDTLGIWLSDWAWNSYIGKERWQEGLVMDLCRGNLLAQIWTDEQWLSPDERRQIAEFINLLKARPQCFANPRLVLGDPWRAEPYGYCCSDGRRAFIALNNCTWSDVTRQLELNSSWGLPDHQTWDLYRWYPAPAKLESKGKVIGQMTTMAMRPFEILFLEAVPNGHAPSGARIFEIQPLPEDFSEPSRRLEFFSSMAEETQERTTSQNGKTEITGVTVHSASPAYGNRLPEHLIDSYGLDTGAGTHSVDADMAMWLDAPPLAGSFVVFNLGGPVTLEAMRIWNYNERAAVDESDRCVQTMDVLVSPSIIEPCWTNLGTFTLARAAAFGNETVDFSQTLPLKAQRVQYVKFEIKNNFGDENGFAGLSKVRFYGTPHFNMRPNATRFLSLDGMVPASSKGGLLALTSQGRRLAFHQARIAGKATAVSPSPKGASWQVWRAAIGSSIGSQGFEFLIRANQSGEGIAKSCTVYFIPN